jgi:transposase
MDIRLLLLHIKYVKWLEAKYKRPVLLQEDNNPSHGNRRKYNSPTKLKSNTHLKTINHPAYSPDLSPIERIWMILKKRLRGGRRKTLEEFKAAIIREWKRVTKA